MKKSDLWLMIGGIVGAWCFWWAYEWNISHGKSWRPGDDPINLWDPPFFFIALLFSTFCYVFSASYLFKELKEKGKKNTGYIAAGFQSVGAVMVGLWVIFYAYDKYNQWEHMAWWIVAGLLFLFVAPRLVVKI